MWSCCISDAYAPCTHNIFAITLALLWKPSSLHTSKSASTCVRTEFIVWRWFLKLMTETPKGAFTFLTAIKLEQEIAFAECAEVLLVLPPVTISVRDRSQTLVRGGLMQKIFIAKVFQGPLSDCKKIFRAPFLPWKLWVNPIEKHVNSIFNGKSVVIFFRAPLQGSKILRAPPFCIRPPLTSICERSLRFQVGSDINAILWSLYAHVGTFFCEHAYIHTPTGLQDKIKAHVLMCPVKCPLTSLLIWNCTDGSNTHSLI